MNQQEFLALVEEAIEADAGTVQGDEALEDLDGWDSMAVLNFIALIDEQTGEIIDPKVLAECKTVQDLAALVGVPSV